MAHRESEAASTAAASAVALVENLKFELREEHEDYAASLKQDVIDPLRVEMVAALA